MAQERSAYVRLSSVGSPGSRDIFRPVKGSRITANIDLKMSKRKGGSANVVMVGGVCTSCAYEGSRTSARRVGGDLVRYKGLLFDTTDGETAKVVSQVGCKEWTWRLTCVSKFDISSEGANGC